MILKRGQVTLLVLLLGLLGLTITLSAASRSLSDLRQATVVDQGTKALAAAESGIQYALSQLGAGAAPNCTPETTQTVSNVTLSNITGVQYNICANVANYGVYGGIPQDDVLQVNIGNQQANVKGLTVVWKNPAASMEVIKVNVDKITGEVTEARYLYNGTSTSADYLAKISGNSFAPSVAGSNCVRTSGGSVCADTSFNNGSCAGYYGEIPYSWGGGAGDTYLRVKPVYASTDIAVCNTPAGGSSGNLSLQYYQITAIATASGGVTRKVQTTHLSNFLPSIFDNVLYSGGNLAK